MHPHQKLIPNRDGSDFIQVLVAEVTQTSLHITGPSWLCLCPSPGGTSWQRWGAPTVYWVLHGQRSLVGYSPWGRKRVSVYALIQTSLSLMRQVSLLSYRWGSQGSPRSVSGPRSPRAEPKSAGLGSGIWVPGFWSWLPYFLTQSLCLSSLTSPCLSLLICKMGMTSVFPPPPDPRPRTEVYWEDSARCWEKSPSSPALPGLPPPILPQCLPLLGTGPGGVRGFQNSWTSQEVGNRPRNFQYQMPDSRFLFHPKKRLPLFPPESHLWASRECCRA